MNVSRARTQATIVLLSTKLMRQVCDEAGNGEVDSRCDQGTGLPTTFTQPDLTFCFINSQAIKTPKTYNYWRPKLPCRHNADRYGLKSWGDLLRLVSSCYETVQQQICFILSRSLDRVNIFTEHPSQDMLIKCHVNGAHMLCSKDVPGCIERLQGRSSMFASRLQPHGRL